LLFIDQCAAHLKNTTLLSNITAVFLSGNCSNQLQPLDLGIIHAFNCHYRKQLIWKTVAMMDGVLFQDATQMKYVLSAMHFISQAWRLITSATIKNFFVKCGFSNDHFSSNDSVMKLNDDEKNDWHSLQVQFENCTTCGSALEVCEIWSVDQVFDQHLLTRPEEEEVAELKQQSL
jgi:hypothetical protein